ncbi:MAG: photosynthetic reaction center cytochrome c subunit, partial [Sphingobacteriales bacterium]|nr:photosynthetic reaction center cytochrome c subunit [Sphingobacteriales bacterium]
VSDAKSEKEISRSMMRMTIDINKTHFKIKDAAIENADLPVTCITCHHGLPYPSVDSLENKYK